MTVNTEIRISRNAADEFRNSMAAVDLDSVSLRDKFMDDVTSSTDGSGTLVINAADMDIDLGVLKGC